MVGPSGTIGLRESSIVFWCLIISLLSASMSIADEVRESPVDLTELSLEELMEIEITSVSKKEERLFAAAAAAYVLTAEDIRRSGATSIPEALRMVPGMEVARIDASKWAITVRGFNNRFANKLLVLIDGRSVYSPFFSGVFWDVQDVLLEDIERIEVIRGPGATLWGANAVNGVVNIITRNAKDTQGRLVRAGAGSEERAFGEIRYGGKIGDALHYRAYGKYVKRDAFVYASGDRAADGWDVLRAGFRVDGEMWGAHTLTLRGDIYGDTFGHRLSTVSLEPPYEQISDAEGYDNGGNLLGRWRRTFSETSDLAIQLYYDWVGRDEGMISAEIRTFDVDIQHRFGVNTRQEIIWGFGYRLIDDEYDGTFDMSVHPEERSVHLFNAFAQDELTLIEDRLRLTLGSKFEHNDYTGFEIQPNARMLWRPDERHTAWTAISRAIRTPSRAENDGRYVGEVIPQDLLSSGVPIALTVLHGSPDFEAEDLLAFELGYRLYPTDRIFLDAASFYNRYDHLRTGRLDTLFVETRPAPEHLVIGLLPDNGMYGESYGAELVADWRALEGWRLRVAYTYLKIQMYLRKGSADIGSVNEAQEKSPRGQFFLYSSMDLPRNLALDLGVRYVDDLPNRTENYLRLDARLGWTPHEHVELAIVGQNLLERHHPEYKPELLYTLPTEVERGVYGTITWRF